MAGLMQFDHFYICLLLCGVVVVRRASETSYRVYIVLLYPYDLFLHIGSDSVLLLIIIVYIIGFTIQVYNL